MRQQVQRRPMTIEGYLTALVADSKGNIIDLEGYGAVGMAGRHFIPLREADTLPLPHGSELMLLPDRVPILFDFKSGKWGPIAENPYHPGERVFPIAGFNSPGYVHRLAPAFEERANANSLPLFAYGAVGWHPRGFRSAVFQIDRERRQDLRLMPLEKVHQGIREMQKRFPRNRLRRHLEKCALTYGCPAAKNFFIGRCEAPLPTSSRCNARCLGCLSFQSAEALSHCQDRIDFLPTPQEIAEIAVAHLSRVTNGVVSFGQGCEGDPLLAAEVIEPAIREIRSRTTNGIINMNTNGSLPDVLETFFDAGLDSIRVSLNSVRENCYVAYFRPKGYAFSDVLGSIERGISRRRHVAINYLNMAGVTDTPEEKTALLKFLDRYPIQQIQWRNLNFDPLRYWREMHSVEIQGDPIGMKQLVDLIRSRYPRLRHGYFNPMLSRSVSHSK